MRVVGSGGRFEVVESSIFLECGSVVTNRRSCFFFLVNRVAHSHNTHRGYLTGSSPPVHPMLFHLGSHLHC